MIDEVYLCSNKCRLCLCNEKFQIPIFGEVAQEMQICLKIRTCLPIKVSQEDDFPKNICYKCVAALEQSYNLWRVSSESEAVLKNLTSKANQDLSGANMQHQGCQSFGSRLNRAPSRANRKLLLPTGISLILESDSEEEHGQAAEMNSPETQPAARVMGQEPTAWLWESGTVMMDTSPDFLDSLSEPSPRSTRQTSQTEPMNSSPHILESLTHAVPNTRDMKTKESSPSSRWRSISLFGKSANTWRDLFRHREVREDRHRFPASPSVMTEGATTAPQPVDSRSYEDILKAMNERNCKVISQCSDTPSALLNFLRTQKPLVHADLDIPQQGPK